MADKPSPLTQVVDPEILAMVRQTYSPMSHAAASGFTFGLSDLVEKGFSFVGDRVNGTIRSFVKGGSISDNIAFVQDRTEQIKRAKEIIDKESPIATTAGEVIGTVAGLAVGTTEARILATGGKMVAEKVGGEASTKLGATGVKTAEGIVEKATSKLERKTEGIIDAIKEKIASGTAKPLEGRHAMARGPRRASTGPTIEDRLREEIRLKKVDMDAADVLRGRLGVSGKKQASYLAAKADYTEAQLRLAAYNAGIDTTDAAATGKYVREAIAAKGPQLSLNPLKGFNVPAILGHNLIVRPLAYVPRAYKAGIPALGVAALVGVAIHEYNKSGDPLKATEALPVIGGPIKGVEGAVNTAISAPQVESSKLSVKLAPADGVQSFDGKDRKDAICKDPVLFARYGEKYNCPAPGQ